MGQNQHAATPLLHRVAADAGHHRGLARGCWQHDARIIIPAAQVVVDGIDCFNLVWAELHHHVITAVSVAAASQ